MKTSKVIKYIISLGVAVLLMYFAFRGVSWKEFIDDMKQCNWLFVCGSMAASIGAFWCRSKRWRILISPFDKTLDTLSAFNGVTIGYLANFVFPRIGEVVRCGFVSRRSHARHKEDPENAITFDKTLGTVILSRTWDIVVVFLLLAFLLIARWNKFGDFFINKMWEPFSEGSDFSLGWIFGLFNGLLILFILLCYVLRNKYKFFRKIADFLKGTWSGFKSCFKIENKAGFFIYTILLWTMYCLMIYCTILAVPATSEVMSGIDALFICIAGSLGWMVPVPGGFGSYHGIVALAISSIYAISWENGLLCATLSHEAQMITMVVCGIVSYFIEVVRK